MSDDNSPTTLQALIVIFVCLGVGLGIAALAGRELPTIAGVNALTALAVVMFGVQWIAWLPSTLAQTERFYDVVGSITYLTSVGLALAVADAITARSILVAGFVVVWAGRLGTFLLRRALKHGDGRFDAIKTRPLRFLMAWTMQGLWIFLTALGAVLIILDPDPGRPIGAFDVVGGTLWIAGFVVEAVADVQKSAFKNAPNNEREFITTGLWAWSRHPNYFGEIVLWVGVFVIGAGGFGGWQWLAVLSPLFVTFLLTRVSGIPMLEARANKRWGDDPDYVDYRERTPVLIPRPPR